MFSCFVGFTFIQILISVHWKTLKLSLWDRNSKMSEGILFLEVFINRNQWLPYCAHRQICFTDSNVFFSVICRSSSGLPAISPSPQGLQHTFLSYKGFWLNKNFLPESVLKELMSLQMKTKFVTKNLVSRILVVINDWLALLSCW